MLEIPTVVVGVKVVSPKSAVIDCAEVRDAEPAEDTVKELVTAPPIPKVTVRLAPRPETYRAILFILKGRVPSWDNRALGRYRVQDEAELLYPVTFSGEENPFMYAISPEP